MPQEAAAETTKPVKEALKGGGKLSSLLEHFPGAGTSAPKGAKAMGPRLQRRGSGASKRSA